AARLARRCDERLEGRSYVRAAVDLPIRYAIEVRHERFFEERFLEVLRGRDIAFVISDAAGHWPRGEHVTASFVYIRLHGAEELYASGYSPLQLADWAKRCRAQIRSGRDVYVYFDNDARGHAPFDAMQLLRMLSGPPSSRAGAPDR